jgi:hypothetical protein
MNYENHVIFSLSPKETVSQYEKNRILGKGERRSGGEDLER